MKMQKGIMSSSCHAQRCIVQCGATVHYSTTEYATLHYSTIPSQKTILPQSVNLDVAASLSVYRATARGNIVGERGGHNVGERIDKKHRPAQIAARSFGT